jgi:ribosomal protein L7/L12
MSIAAIAIIVVALVATAIACALVLRKGRAASGANPAPPDLSAFDDATFRARVVDEIEAGRKIDAITMVRERTRLGLADAKALVEALASGADGVDLRLVRTSSADDVAQATIDDPDLAAQLVLELAAGRRIEAIRLLRERTGLGLKEAKDAIDAMDGDASAHRDRP